MLAIPLLYLCVLDTMMASAETAGVKLVCDVAEVLRYAGSDDGGVDGDYEKAVDVDAVRVRFLMAGVEAHGPAVAAGRAASACKLCTVGRARSALIRKLQLDMVMSLGYTKCEHPIARARPVSHVDDVLFHCMAHDIAHFSMTRSPMPNEYTRITRTPLDSVDPVLLVEQMAGRVVYARQERRANTKQDVRMEMLKKLATPERIPGRLPYGQVPGVSFWDRGGLGLMPGVVAAGTSRCQLQASMFAWSGGLRRFSCDTGAPRQPPAGGGAAMLERRVCARIRAHQVSSLRRVRPCHGHPIRSPGASCGGGIEAVRPDLKHAQMGQRGAPSAEAARHLCESCKGGWL